jgi:hypothetical protein
MFENVQSFEHMHLKFGRSTNMAIFFVSSQTLIKSIKKRFSADPN